MLNGVFLDSNYNPFRAIQMDFRKPTLGITALLKNEVLIYF